MGSEDQLGQNQLPGASGLAAGPAAGPGAIDNFSGLFFYSLHLTSLSTTIVPIDFGDLMVQHCSCVMQCGCLSRGRTQRCTWRRPRLTFRHWSSRYTAGYLHPFPVGLVIVSDPIQDALVHSTASQTCRMSSAMHRGLLRPDTPAHAHQSSNPTPAAASAAHLVALIPHKKLSCSC